MKNTATAIGIVGTIVLLALGAGAWQTNYVELGKTFHKTASQTEDAALTATVDVVSGDNVTMSVWNATQSGTGTTYPVVFFWPPNGVWNSTGGTNELSIVESTQSVQCNYKAIPFVGTGSCWVVAASAGAMTLSFDIATPSTGSVSVDLNVTVVRAPSPADPLDALRQELQNLSDALNATKAKLDALNASGANASDITQLQQILDNLTVELTNVTNQIQNVTGTNTTTVVYNNSTVVQNQTVYQNTTNDIWHNETVERNTTVYQNTTVNGTEGPNATYDDAKLKKQLADLNKTVEALSGENAKLKDDIDALKENGTKKDVGTKPAVADSSQATAAGVGAGVAAGAVAGTAASTLGGSRASKKSEDAAEEEGSKVDLDEQVKPEE